MPFIGGGALVSEQCLPGGDVIVSELITPYTRRRGARVSTSPWTLLIGFASDYQLVFLHFFLRDRRKEPIH